EVLVRGQPERALMHLRDGPQPIHQPVRRAGMQPAAPDIEGEMVASVLALAPAQAVAIAGELTRPGRLEGEPLPPGDFAADPVQALVVDRIFEAGSRPVGAIAVIA